MARNKRASGVVRYHFRKARSWTLSALRESDPIARTQVVRTLEIRNGDSFDDFEECAAAVPRLFDVDEDALGLDHYVISLEGEPQPSYEMWVYLDEHGLVFEMGSEVPTPVHCVQGHFWSVDDEDRVAAMLAKALERGAPF
jgi:hypothetical protein